MRTESVLVIEAGAAYDNPNIRLLYSATYTLNETLLWGYVSQPERLASKSSNVHAATTALRQPWKAQLYVTLSFG